MPDLHAIDYRIVARDVDRDRVDIRRNALRLGPERQRGESEKARPSADVRNVREPRALPLEPVERFEASCRRRMLAGPEGKACIDLERHRARRGISIHRRMDVETAR